MQYWMPCYELLNNVYRIIAVVIGNFTYVNMEFPKFSKGNFY